MNTTETPIAIDALPVPRLEIYWQGKGRGEFVCWYELVFHIDKIDIRAERPGKRSEEGYPWFDGENLRVVLGKTERTGNVGDGYDPPFRDGAHAKWDAVSLGIPAYYVSGSRAWRMIKNAQPPRGKEQG